MNTIIYLKLLLLLFLILASVTLQSQISPFADGEGETSLQLIDYNSIIINAKESSFSLGYAPTKYDESAKFNWSINFKSTAKKGVTNIFKSNELNLDGELSIPISKPINDKGDQYIYAIPALKLSNQNIFDPQQSVSNQINSNNYIGYSLALGYNHQNLNDYILGVSIKAGKSDNTALINSLNVQTIKFTSTDSTGMSIATEEKTAFKINEFNNDHSFLRFNFDFGNTFNSNRLIWLIQGSIKADDKFKPLYNLGAGLYLNKEYEPYSVVGGIQLTIQDLAKNRTADTFSKRIGINFIAAIPIN